MKLEAIEHEKQLGSISAEKDRFKREYAHAIVDIGKVREDKVALEEKGCPY